MTFLLLTASNIFSQTKKKLPVLPISQSYSLGFNTYDKEFKMYQNPFIMNNGKKYKIQGYGSANYSEGEILEISPNKRFIVLDHISKGYAEDGISRKLYENYMCVIVDVFKKKVVKYMQGDCSGSWNKDNRWISGDTVIF
ncbi:hypothetical protein [Chryseobacterium aurantiacum]|uniref:hypothetical protein n=1 Tax=Chryseobacterium aurantiacum TaxID=2116499 RepID=UPI0013C4A62F|nr:hypothetical protein [Chryseobacterium aurantiacum]